MNWRTLRVCIGKELLLLWRDKHGLLLLFAMPMIFIVVMSLALQDEFAARAGKKITVLMIDRDASDASHALHRRLSENDAFHIESGQPGDTESIAHSLQKGHAAFAIDIQQGFSDQIAQPPQADTLPLATLWVAPDTAKQTEMIFHAALREAIDRQRAALLIAKVKKFAPELPIAFSENALANPIALAYAYGDERAHPPTAVQQNVPAWLVFGAFFIVIPLSTALIRERQFGTLRRLRSTNISDFTLLASKWLTFFAINQLQVASMLAVGVFVVPALGGEALQLRGSPVAFALLSIALSVATLGYALLIAAASKTTEQATLLGGAGNIILGAIGGVMVPRFIMPTNMQLFSNVSPMAWGLDGFLDVLLRGASATQILPQISALCVFGVMTLVIAWRLLSRHLD